MEQYGHDPLPIDRLRTVASHSWPSGHCHHRFLADPGGISSGVRGSFFTGCHCVARSGRRAESEAVGVVLRPEQ